MKNLILFLNFALLFAPAIAFSDPSESISGLLLADQGVYKLVAPNNSVYKIQAASEEVSTQLNNLKSFDVVRGIGKVIDKKNLLLEYIDYVGLKKLVGKWRSEAALYHFANFEDLIMYNFNSNNIALQKTRLKYVLTPSSDSQWKLFMTNNKDVSVANLDFISEHEIQITFFNDLSGEPIQTMSLLRVTN